MKLDVQRLWKRNMGRDDRCIGDHGKEVFLLLVGIYIFGGLLVLCRSKCNTHFFLITHAYL